MKKTSIIVVAAIAASVAFAAIPRFASPVLVYDGSDSIDVGYYGAPQMVDWDQDGRKDLLLGQFTGGNIRFYPNVGTNSAPVFSGFSYVQASGQIIQLPYG
ncbi:hypothetical protein FJY71_00675 [candidate division WOR-3 bacterium]|nr:hypothetical protein [candidate division WOR-3 bacterium]